MSWINNDLDLPFEPGPRADIDMHGHVASGAVILAGTVDVPDLGRMPALVYRFANPDGSGFYPPMTLVAEPAQLLNLIKLTRAAVLAANKAAIG